MKLFSVLAVLAGVSALAAPAYDSKLDFTRSALTPRDTTFCDVNDADACPAGCYCAAIAFLDSYGICVGGSECAVVLPTSSETIDNPATSATAGVVITTDLGATGATAVPIVTAVTGAGPISQA